jgi:hypothetical protein
VLSVQDPLASVGHVSPNEGICQNGCASLVTLHFKPGGGGGGVINVTAGVMSGGKSSGLTNHLPP